MYATSYPKRGTYDKMGYKKRCLWTGPEALLLAREVFDVITVASSLFFFYN